MRKGGDLKERETVRSLFSDCMNKKEEKKRLREECLQLVFHSPILQLEERGREEREAPNTQI